MNYLTGQTSGGMVLRINVIPEPKLHVLGTINFNWLKDCVDDQGHSLMPTSTNRRFFNPGFMMRGGPPQSLWMLQINLNDVPNRGSKIARLHGEANLLAQTRSQTFEIDDITHSGNAAVQDGPASFTIASYSKTQMNFQLSLMIGGITINDPRIQDIANSAELVDDKDQTTLRQNCIPRPSPQGVNVILIFPAMQNTPVKLRWERTLEQKRLSIPFELDNLPFSPGR